MNKPLYAFALVLAFAVTHRSASAQQSSAGRDGSISVQMDAIFKKYNHTQGPGCAVAVIKGDKVVFERSYGMANLEYRLPITSNSIFDLCSLTKQFTGLAISMLVQQGKISMDDDIRKYLPQVPDFGKVITVSNLVHHTSGLRDYPEALMIAGWRYSELCTLDDVMRLVAHQKELDFDPGSQWSYCNTGYVLLAALVEKVTGESFPNWVKRHIFQPLGMNHSFIKADSRTIVPNLATSYARTEQGYLKYSDVLSAYGSSCMYSSLKDMSRWVIHLQAAIHARDAVYTRLLEKIHLINGGNINYAYGLEIWPYKGVKTIYHSGAWAGYRTQIMIFPDDQLAFITLSNADDDDLSAGYARSIADLLLQKNDDRSQAQNDRSRPTDYSKSPTVAVDTSLLRKYAGTYQLTPTRFMTITLENGQLIVQSTGEDKTSMQAKSESVFWVSDYHSTITFVLISLTKTNSPATSACCFFLETSRSRLLAISCLAIMSKTSAL
jgi:CubicO group peptidase (beta-lactamase class C family)